MNHPKRILDSTSKESFLGRLSDPTTSIYFDILLKIAKPSNRIKFFLLVDKKFAEDLAAGQITQEHDSLDLVTTYTDLPVLREMFYKANFKILQHKSSDPDKSFQAHTHIEDTGIDIYIYVVTLDKPKGEVTETIWERMIDDVSLQFSPPHEH